MKAEDGVSLKEYINLKIRSIEKAIKIAHKVMNRRLEGMNEFRHQLDKQASEFITRKEFMTLLVAEIALISLIVTILFKLMK